MPNYSAASATCRDTITAAVSLVRILTEVFQDKNLLICFCELTFNVCGVLAVDQRSGCFTFRVNCVLDVAAAHSVIVVQLTELLGDVVVYRGNALLCLAAAVCKLCLKITLSELGLVTDLCNVGVCGCKLGTESSGEIAESVADPVDILSNEIETSFIPRGCCCIAYREISTEDTDAGVTSASVSASAETTEPTATETAPAEEDKKNDPCEPSAFHAIAVSAVSVVHECKSFPAVERITVGINVIDWECFYRF